uniref:Uncharacterized protein n=2 Tax=Sus scrofa TaxID=9823 RepID=A0A8D1RNL7_PIG
MEYYSAIDKNKIIQVLIDPPMTVKNIFYLLVSVVFTDLFVRCISISKVHLLLLESLPEACILGNSLGALGHGRLGQLPWQQQAHGRLDHPGCDG